MRRLRAVALVALVLGTTAASASAQTTRFGQSFQAPAGTPVLESIDAGLLSTYSGSAFVFELFAYDDVLDQFTGTPLWQLAVGPVVEFTHLDLNVTLTGGQMFALLLDGQGGKTMTHNIDYRDPGRALVCEDTDCSLNAEFILSKDIDDFQLTWGSASEVPEPLTLLLLGSGLAGLAGARRRSRV